ncbi:MAG: hypothetical protein J6M90_04850 [Oscillospiraceae bacterium]|nr:hypothetical protein [Oscillospiraceae bacterium]MBR4346662.1 hypothetical protein [Oscillospiraceae bacterium]
MKVNITGGPIPQAEVDEYVKRAEELHPGTTAIDIAVDGDYVDISYHIMPFDRIRRITGYLVGTLDRFNDAKRAEVGDRVKHTL